jgi:Domain of unknown function (DUF5655)
MPDRPLWTCSRCGRTFVNRNQSHTCAALGSVDAHFDGKDSSLRAAFDRVLAVLAPLGPVEVLAERSRIALHARMSFAAFTPRRHWLGGHLVLARKADHPLFRKVEVYSAHNVLHAFRLTTPSDVDNAFAALLVEAYGVGRQEHVRR